MKRKARDYVSRLTFHVLAEMQIGVVAPKEAGEIVLEPDGIARTSTQLSAGLVEKSLGSFGHGNASET